MSAPDVEKEWISLREASALNRNPRSSRSKNISLLWETSRSNHDIEPPKKGIKNKKLPKSLLELTYGLTSCRNKETFLDKSPKIAAKEKSNHTDSLSGLFEKKINSDETMSREWHGGDSDDDSDFESVGSVEMEQSSPYSNMRIERLANMIQSEERSVRLEAIAFVENEIRALTETIKSIPPLHTKPPYSIENITLTHQQYGATVSDLAKGDHVSGWQQWQRTQVPITKQFPDRPVLKAVRAFVIDPANDSIDDSEAIARQKLQKILNVCGSAFFKTFSDPVEKCRSSAIECIRMLCISGLNFSKQIPYLMPAIFSKYPETKYDPEMKLFVTDIESHSFYKRGGATQRQDRKHIVGRGAYKVRIGESSEEIRLQLLDLLSCILRLCIHLKVLSFLDPYFTDTILAVQSALNDPFVKLKVNAAELLIHILRVPSWEDGAKYYATAIARTSLPHLRHRNARVRFSFIGLFEASISVPDREKIKGAGTEAIVDLVGFKEENVLPIAAFYKAECGVTVNSLAELVIDKNANVRYRCCQMLAFLMCCLPDRYDYHQRLLPYLLSFYSDDHGRIREQAIAAVEQCGCQFEAENPNDIIERRQYGVDGDSRCNHVDPLPLPFKQRPRIGARLFVRGNTKRFFSALLRELRSWISKTRHQSAKLIHILIIYCEEHLTMDLHETLNGIGKALRSCIKESDKESREEQVTLESILVTMGRYIDPDTYVTLLLPKIVGDDVHADEGISSDLARAANIIALRCLIMGSLPRRLLSFIFVLLPKLSSQAVLGDLVGKRIRIECLKTLDVIFQRIKNHSINGAQTAHFEETGRLCSGDDTMKRFKAALKELLVSSYSEKEVIDLAIRIEMNIPREPLDN